MPSHITYKGHEDCDSDKTAERMRTVQADMIKIEDTNTGM